MKKLASDDKKEVRVVILTYTPELETRPEFIQADRQLAEMLAQTLRDSCETNNENVTIVNPHKVEEFKSDHPNWQQEPNLAEIGRQFKADYVIYIEISHLSMYEKGSRQHSTTARPTCRSSWWTSTSRPRGRCRSRFPTSTPTPRGRSRSRTCSRWSSARSSSTYIAMRLGRFFTATPIQETYYEDGAAMTVFVAGRGVDVRAAGDPLP